MRLACVGVDLDSVEHYCRIHGLENASLSRDAARAVYCRALGRFVELFAELGVRATFFAVGKDLADRESAQAVREAARAGHEIGNHSFSHDYALTRRGAQDLARDVAEGERAVAEAAGRLPRGFRAPGYTLTAELMAVLAERGYAYDSSAFPAAPYYLAKAAIMALLAFAGRPSQAILDRPRVLLAPREPYRPHGGEPYRRGDLSLLELPIAVEPLTRAPFIGATLVMLPGLAVRGLYRSLRRTRFLNLELHGIDLLDEGDVGLPALARVQRDLSVPWREKRRRLETVLRWMVADYDVATLEQAAQALGAKD